MYLLSALRGGQITNKTVILRVDFNIETAKETFRLKASLPTIEFLLQNNCKIVLLSHRGRPEIKDQSAKIKINKEYSLKIVLPFLKKNLRSTIKFFNHFDFPKITAVIKAAPPKSIFLLENLRLLADEEANKPELGRELARLGDLFVNDAFAVSHRNNSSITQLPKYLPNCAGLLLEKEITALGKLLGPSHKPLVIILGGAKASDKIGVIKHFMDQANCFLVGGMAANTFLKAQGVDIFDSGYEPEMVTTAKNLLDSPKIILPVDFVLGQNKYLDIGSKSVAVFSEKIKTAQTIFWNGPMGLFENPKYINGSKAIALAIAKTKAFSVLGGGETTYLIHKLGLEKKFSFLSTGGGAMLEFLSGKKLPGIEALK